uniref:Paraoxonase n=1 Tax=Amphiprion percula TaxID=161767 RepID=A0A3P8T6N9_AMPPE
MSLKSIQLTVCQVSAGQNTTALCENGGGEGLFLFIFLFCTECGAEDITILKDGLAFFSSGLKFPEMHSFCDEPGKMYVLNLELDLSSFNPHGISVYTDETDDNIYVFVVNHPHEASQVEIFRFVAEDTLVHLKTITHPLLHSVNDIVAVGKESFYATNHFSFPNQALHFLTIILAMPMCDVVYYSPSEVRVAAGGIMSGNGINISPDKRYIYVSDILDHEIDIFERKKERLNELNVTHLLPLEVLSVGVGSLCDNIEVDHRTGDLWLGCHPNPMKMLNFDLKDPPGSEILKIKNIHSEHPVVSMEYADNGQVIMASTVAAPYEGKLLIGTVFHKALYCDLR